MTQTETNPIGTMERLRRCDEAFDQIIARSHNGTLGTSKVADMRKIAEQAKKDILK